MIVNRPRIHRDDSPEPSGDNLAAAALFVACVATATLAAVLVLELLK